MYLAASLNPARAARKIMVCPKLKGNALYEIPTASSREAKKLCDVVVVEYLREPNTVWSVKILIIIRVR